MTCRGVVRHGIDFVLVEVETEGVKCLCEFPARNNAILVSVEDTEDIVVAYILISIVDCEEVEKMLKSEGVWDLMTGRDASSFLDECAKFLVGGPLVAEILDNLGKVVRVNASVVVQVEEIEDVLEIRYGMVGYVLFRQGGCAMAGHSSPKATLGDDEANGLER